MNALVTEPFVLGTGVSHSVTEVFALITEGRDSVTEGFALVTEASASVKEKNALVTEASALVTGVKGLVSVEGGVKKVVYYCSTILKADAMKKITLIIFFLFTINFIYAQTNVSGGIFANTTWTFANSPYIVVDTVVVFPGVTLTIEPGVIVKFDDTKYLEIRQGTLIANGNAADSITFTSNSATPAPGIWGGILLRINGTLPSTFNFCSIHYSTTGIDGVFGGGNILYIKNSVFTYNGYGIDNIDISTIDSCIFKYNSTGMEHISRVQANFCTVVNNTTGIYYLNQSTMVNSIIDSNQTGIDYLAYWSSIESSSISHNQTGIISSTIGSDIKYCTIDYNSIQGIFLDGTDSDSLINCEIKYNGIGIKDGSVGSHVVIQCSIESNNTGIRMIYGSPHYYCNRICNNTSYGLYYTGTTNYSMANNYWCTPDSASTEAVIYDGYDNLSYGLVNFMPLDAAQCYLATGIPIYEDHIFSFNIFPNPATDKISVSGFTGRGEINIYNTMGERVKALTLNPSPSGEGLRSIDVSELSPGLYFVKVLAEEKFVVRKIIKQ